MAHEKIRRDKAIPIPEHQEIKKEEILWQGTLATEFVLSTDPLTGKKKLLCVEVNGHNSQFLDYVDIEGVKKADKNLVEVRMHRNEDRLEKIRRRREIFDEMDDGTFLRGSDDEVLSRIVQYLRDVINKRSLSKNGNTNPLPIEKLALNKENMEEFVPVAFRPRSWSIDKLVDEENPPKYLIVKPLSGMRGKDIRIMPYKFLVPSINRIKRTFEAWREELRKEERNVSKIRVLRAELEKAMDLISTYSDYTIQEFVESDASENTPKELKNNKSTIRYAIDFTVTKSGKIIPSFVRSYASVIEKKRNIASEPEYEADVLSGDSKVKVFKLSEEEEKQAKEITEAVIQNLTNKFFPN